jgi:DNA repair protein RecN (Recombination protein N)
VPVTLASIHIRNLALVEELQWNLAAGFIAVTGETGSGKSIIIGALKLLLGERADKTLIRTGAESCTVEAIFEMDDTNEVDARLAEQGLEPCADRSLILKRSFSAAGANRQFVNCSATTLAVLKELGDALVDLHGPHDHQSLLSSEKQLEVLDAFSGAEPLRERFSSQFRALNLLASQRDELAHSEASLEREVDLLQHQVREISAANLAAGEEDALLARYTVATNSRRLTELSAQILQRLSEADDAVLVRLGEVQRLFRDLEKTDANAAQFAHDHAAAVTELEELTRSVQRYSESLDIDAAQLAEMEERVSLFETLKRKYGPALSDVMAFGAEAEERLRKIESRGAELVRLEREMEAARNVLAETGAELSRKRAVAAPKLAREIAAQLCDLGFKKSEFTIPLHPAPKPVASGLEGVDFLFAPNPGEPPKPLKAVASSGEISRVMLAVKTALAAQDRVPLLVFDEIDANVGGEIAHAVGAKMNALGRRHQVLCITHLPQVAAVADAHFVVTKEFANQRTVSHLTEVAGKARVEEIARMLGGKTESALAHARSLLGKA